jgi:hypothetical protein
LLCGPGSWQEQTMRLHRLLALPVLTLVACGDDGTMITQTDPQTSGLTPATIPGTDTTNAATPTTTTVADTGSTAAEGTATEVLTGTGSTTEPSTATEPGPTTSTTTTVDPSTSSEGTDPDTTDPSTTTTTESTTLPCNCDPGELAGCDDMGQQLVCQDDCQTLAPEPCPMGQTCKNGFCAAGFCAPGTKVCNTPDSYEQCNAQGEAFDPPVNCLPDESCFDGECVNLCDKAEAEPSTIGCSFIAARVDNIYGNEIDSFVVGNTSKTKAASVQFYLTPTGTNVEQPQGGPMMIPPGQTVIVPDDQPADRQGLRAAQGRQLPGPEHDPGDRLPALAADRPGDQRRVGAVPRARAPAEPRTSRRGRTATTRTPATST